MATARLLTAGVAALATLLSWTPPAGATDAEGPPRCEEVPLVARVGAERRYELWCGTLDRVRLVDGPAHGTLGDLAHDAASRLSFTFRPDPEQAEPVLDTATVELSGPGGTALRTLIVKIVPPGHNTPPWCLPEGAVRWSDGVSPGTVEFRDVCQDDEQDALTFEGDGPGTFHAVPGRVPAGVSTGARGLLRYRASILRGEEEARFVVTDERGARTRVAVPFRFGPDVNRPPTCWTPWTTIRVRVGIPRRFAVECSDPEDDPFRVGIPGHPWWHPWRYDDLGRPSRSSPPRSFTFEVVYTPIPGLMEDDHGTFLASGPSGGSQPLRLTMRPQPPSANVPGTCRGDGRVVATQQNMPVELVLSCQDEDGDPLTASVVTPPAQGSVSAPVVSTAYGGGQHVRLTWTPDPAREGRDAVVLAISDGYGGRTEVVQELEAHGPSYLRLPPPTSLPGLVPPRPPVPPPSPPAPAPQGPASTAGGGLASLADGARAALGTEDVRLRRRVGAARVYVPGTAADAGLPARDAVVWPLAVACPAACAVRATSWTSGTDPRSQTLALAPGTARALELRLTPAQRRAIRRTRGDAASFRITVRPAGGRAVSGRMAVRLRP